MRIEDYQVSKTLAEGSVFNVYQVYHVVTNKKHCMFEMLSVGSHNQFSSPSLTIHHQFTIGKKVYLITDFFDQTILEFSEGLKNYDRTSMYCLVATTIQQLLSMADREDFRAYRLDNIFTYSKTGERMQVLLGIDQLPQDPIFNSPETYKLGEITKASQVWSVGILLYYLCHNYSPYKAFGTSDIPTLVQTNQLTPVSRNVADEFRQLIETMLHPNPQQRQSLYLLLRSPVFKKYVK